MNKRPRDIELKMEFEPDKERMVRALRVLLEWNPGKAGEQNQVQVQFEDEKTA